MSKQTKEELIKALNSLDVQLDRVIKIAETLDEPEDRESIDKLTDQIIDVTNKLSKL
jgi:hypothetical protein